MITIYHNPRCSKSRQTLGLIEEKGHDFVVKEYLKNTPTKEELTKVIGLLGIKPDQLIRKGESDFKDNFKGKELSDEEWIDAMIAYPKLIERPIVIKGDKAVLGRPPENVLTLL
ncbi:arsenate reductase [Ekhidna lutea]|uniref:Arsenate reductase n=1 Tax=Ekhidna lutea TaxID=447679 RepID=A0A239K0F2_EKHLU|nr:arsenate reductase (glutaredoxin) [Ekhidna lutea]SNT10534.1 arsenate reductase [Ekhidna lutea]